MKLRIFYSYDKPLGRDYLRACRIVRAAVKGALAYEAFPYNAEVSVTFTDNAGIHELNLSHRGIDRPTDVLSFPMYDFRAGELPDDCGAVQLGDIVISLEKAREQAIEYGHTLKREIAFLAVHSTLHLLGYDHELSEKDETDMFRRQDEIMEKLGITRK